MIFGCVMMCCSEALHGHGGGLDSSGGHRNRSTGGYHYHRSSAASYIPVRQPAVRVNYRTIAPTKSRTQVRTVPARSGNLDQDDVIKNLPSFPKITKPVVRKLRTWTSADGNFKVEARFKSYMLNVESKGLVSIETTEGNLLKVKSLDFSTSDRQYLRTIIGSKPGL